MNFKTPFKVLTTAALIGTLSLSAVAPGAASAASTVNKVSTKAEADQPTTKIEKIIITKDNKDYTIDRVLYNQLLDVNDASVKDATITAVVAADGTYYTREAYSQALAATDSVQEAFAALEEIAKTNPEVLVETIPGSIEIGEGGVEVKDPTETPDSDFKVTEIAAITTKKIEVKFNKATEVTAENFLVKKGSATSNISSVTIADDKKSAVIELASKLTAGDYTISVKNGEETVSKTLTAEDEKVDKVELLSETAVLDDNDSKKATVGFKVSNQYGEDITKTVESDLTYTASNKVTAAGSKGIVTLTSGTALKAGDKVTLTVVDSATGTSVSKTITISDESAVAEVSVGDIYNKDGKKLTTDSDLTKDNFYIPVTVKDQYGNEITKAEKANDGITITNQTPAVATFGAELETVTIDDKDVLAIKVNSVLAAGTAKALVIANATGKNATATTTVGEGVKINSLSIGDADKVISEGADAYFPVTITDSEGNEVKTEKALGDIKDTVTVSGTAGIAQPKEVEGKEGLFIKVPASDLKEGKAFTITATTQSGKVTTKTVTPKAAAVAKTIVGLSDEVTTAIREGGNIDIANTDLVVEDQYNQKLDATQLATVKFVVESNATEGKEPFELTNTENTSWKIADAENAAAKDSDKLVFTLLDEKGEKITSSALDKTFTIAKNDDLSSYAVADVKPVYVKYDEDAETYTIPTTYQQNFKVTAQSKAGATVNLDNSGEYAVTGDVTVDNGKVTVVTGLKPADFKDGVATKTATVTINANGEELTKEITFSTVAPKAEKIQYVKDASANKLEDVAKLNITSGDSTSPYSLPKASENSDLVIFDQYGVKNTKDADNTAVEGVFTGLISNATVTYQVVSGKATFANNGKNDAQVVTASAGAVVKATVKSGDKSVAVELTFTDKLQTAEQKTAEELAANQKDVDSKLANIVAKAKTAVLKNVENTSVTAVTAETAKAAVENAAKADLADSYTVTIEAVENGFTEATNGTSESSTGTAGSYKFKVKLSKGSGATEATATSEEQTLTIAPVPFTTGG